MWICGCRERGVISKGDRCRRKSSAHRRWTDPGLEPAPAPKVPTPPVAECSRGQVLAARAQHEGLPTLPAQTRAAGSGRERALGYLVTESIAISKH